MGVVTFLNRHTDDAGKEPQGTGHRAQSTGHRAQDSTNQPINQSTIRLLVRKNQKYQPIEEFLINSFNILKEFL